MSKTDLEKEFKKFFKSLNKLMKESNFKELIKKYAEREEQFKDHPQFWINYGVNIFTTLDFNKALKTMERALEIDPKHTEALMRIGALYSYTGKLDKTKSYIEKVLKIDPKHEEALFTFYEYWRTKDRIAKQINCLEKLIEAYPESDLYWEKLIGIYKSKNNADKIIECYTKLKDLHPEEPDYWWILGHHYLMTKRDWDNALLILKKAVEMDDTKFEYLRDLAYAYVAKEERITAIDYLEKALILNPKDKDAWGILVAAYRGSSNPEKAEETKERAEKCLYSDYPLQASYEAPESVQEALKDFVKEAILTNEEWDSKKKIENMIVKNIRPIFIPTLLELSDEDITWLITQYQGKLSAKHNEHLSNLNEIYENFNTEKESTKSKKADKLEKTCWQELHSCFQLDKKAKKEKLEEVIDIFVETLVNNPKSIASLVGIGIALISCSINRDDALEFFAKASIINDELTSRILTEQNQLSNLQKLHRAVLYVV